MRLYVDNEEVAVGGFSSHDGALLAMVSMRREGGVITERKVNFFGRLYGSDGNEWSVDFLTMEDIERTKRISVVFDELDGEIAVRPDSMVADSDSEIVKRARYNYYLALKKEFEPG